MWVGARVRVQAGIVAVCAVMTLTACTSGAHAALADAQQACADLGYVDGKIKSSETDDSDDPWSASEWAETADGYDATADRAARAARADARWNRLSNAITDFQAMTEQMAIVENTTLPQSDRDAAQVQLDQLDLNAMTRTIDQECRKAQVR